jgi:hypothetical protein
MNSMFEGADDLIPALGELDLLKEALSSVERTLTISFASGDVSKHLKLSAQLKMLSRLEAIYSDVVSLRSDLLKTAGKVSEKAGKKNIDNPIITKKENKKPTPPPTNKDTNAQNNPLVNNVLDYLNERLSEEEGDNEQ